MEYMDFDCSKCEKATKQIIRIVDDRMPEYVKCLECVKCGLATIKLIKEQTNGS